MGDSSVIPIDQRRERKRDSRAGGKARGMCRANQADSTAALRRINVLALPGVY